jgi:hypothetical protein
VKLPENQSTSTSTIVDGFASVNFELCMLKLGSFEISLGCDKENVTQLTNRVWKHVSTLKFLLTFAETPLRNVATVRDIKYRTRTHATRGRPLLGNRTVNEPSKQ